MTHEDIQSDLALYALGSLDAEERQAIEQHLAAGCDSCAQELLAWREVVGMVPFEGPARAAPDLKAKLMVRVRAEAKRDAAKPVETTKVARRRIGWAVPFAAAALALLAFATYREIGWRAERQRLAQERARQAEAIVSLQHDLETARGDFSRVSAALAQRETDIATLRAALAKAEEALSIVQRPGLNLVALKETKDQPPAAGHVLLSVPTGKALFYAFGLPPVPDRVRHAGGAGGRGAGDSSCHDSRWRRAPSSRVRRLRFEEVEHPIQADEKAGRDAADA
jgi:anti-sigma-K factor RskA